MLKSKFVDPTLGFKPFDLQNDDHVPQRLRESLTSQDGDNQRSQLEISSFECNISTINKNESEIGENFVADEEHPDGQRKSSLQIACNQVLCP